MTSSKPVVVGIYGISGSGKSYLVEQLKHKLSGTGFIFFEGSEVINTITPGGLEVFKNLDREEQNHFRILATTEIQQRCREQGMTGVVTGHFMFWTEGEQEGSMVWTLADQRTFTHILYLDVPAPDLERRRQDDDLRARGSASAVHLDRWKQAEEQQLRRLCSVNDILFSRIFPYPDLLPRVVTLLQDFQRHTIERNLLRAFQSIDEAVRDGKDQLESMLVFDGDKTLAAEDTGELFWHRICTDRVSWSTQWTATAVFKTDLGYSHNAFRQVALLYDEATAEGGYDEMCEWVTQQVTPYPDMVSLLKRADRSPVVGAVVVTCGLARVWEKVLERVGLSHSVKVIGGGRTSHDLVVTPALKAALVDRLRNTYSLHVTAFGDSPLDLAMLRKADSAFVVVGDEATRSRSMENRLRSAIDEDGLQASQIIVSDTTKLRLNPKRLPVVSLADADTIQTVFCRRNGLKMHHATAKMSAKFLMAPMRDARVAGPELREKHRRAGFFLAIEFLANILGAEEYDIPHVQGHTAKGHRLSLENQTTIVALMRGGEPMAVGVNDAFPLAGLVHAKMAGDLKKTQLEGRATVILVDSVINTGSSIAEFMKHIRKLNTELRLIIVAGVVQAGAVREGGLLWESSKEQSVEVVALRLSENKFTGSGTTDTGNRLFNTMYLE